MITPVKPFLTNLCVLSWNIHCNYLLLSDLQASSNNYNYDLIFVQEPPWKEIRRTVSTSLPEGDPVIGAPIHPDWLCLFHRDKHQALHEHGDYSFRPRALTYVNK